MKRHLLTIAIFLLLGAAVNVGIAWACSLSTHIARPDRLTLRWRGFGVDRILITSPNIWSTRGSYPKEPPDWLPRFSGSGAVGRTVVAFVAAGWPLPSLHCRLTYSVNCYRCEDQWDGAILLINEEHQLPAMTGSFAARARDRLLPLYPLWRGFAINTLFYAAVLWLLIPGPFVLRRFLRVRRGLCPKCAYPMGESSVCTECGCGLPKRTRTT